MPSEREPRSVRHMHRVSPRSRWRTGDSGCPKVAEEGNAVSMRQKAHARGTRTIVARDPRTRPSLGPSTRSRQSSLHTPRRKFRWWGDGPASRLGKPAQAGGTFTGVGTADVARLAACHRFREEGSVARTEKEGDRGLRPCEDLELGSVCLHVVVVAQIGRRCLASNKLGKRAPKRAVRVE